MKIKLKKYKDNNSFNDVFERKIIKLAKQGLWKKFSSKMKKEFYKPKNWTITEKNVKGKKERTIKIISFKKMNLYKASIKGTEKLKRLRTIEGLNELAIKYHNKYQKYKDNMTIKQEKELRKMKNTLLWTQLQNAKTQQRIETLKQQIKIFKENDLGKLFNTLPTQRFNFTDFLLTYKPEIYEKYANYFKDFTGREGTFEEIISVYKDDIIRDLGWEDLKKGKHDYQTDSYWDDLSNSIIYLDI